MTSFKLLHLQLNYPLRSRPRGNFHHTIFRPHQQESCDAANLYNSNNYTGLYVLKERRKKIGNLLAVFG